MKGAKENIPDRKIGKVLAVVMHLMVDAVAFLALKKESVPVVEQLGESRDEDCNRGCFRRYATEQVKDRAGENPISDYLNWVLIEAGNDLNPLRAVVHLVKPAPEKRYIVTNPVPPVINKYDGDVPDKDLEGRRSSGEAPHTPAFHELIPKDPRGEHAGNLDAVKEHGAVPPSRHLRPAPTWL